MHERTAARQLSGAELWAIPSGTADEPAATDPAAAGAGRAVPRPASFVAGWEDGAPFCAAVCSTDVGLAFCRRCPQKVVSRALATGRAASDQCGAGVRLMAFPAPRGATDQVAVLRVAPPSPRDAVKVADRIRVSPAALRRAARDAPAADGKASLAAARLLRDPAILLDWQVQQRARGSDRRRTATAALAQMIATSEEFHDLYRASQRQRSELERNQRRLDRLARETLRTKDTERARLAHQIHDTAAQSMVSAFRFLEAARASGDGVSGQADGHLSSAAERLLTAIKEVRAVLARLLPPGLEELGLGHALEHRLSELAAESGVQGEVASDLPRLDGWVEQALYGMTTEAMTNAVRHGKAAHLWVELRERRGSAIITIRDDGSGFDPAAVTRRGGGEGLGLLGMSRQASWLGGRASVQSRLGDGTVIRISVPLGRHLLSADAPGPREPKEPEQLSTHEQPSAREQPNGRGHPSGPDRPNGHAKAADPAANVPTPSAVSADTAHDPLIEVHNHATEFADPPTETASAGTGPRSTS